jgi:hypothetical protein
MARIFWISAGFVCASIVAFVLAPQSEHPALMYLIAGLILLGGIARGNKSSHRNQQQVVTTPRLAMCPSCGFSTFDLKKTMLSSVYVVRCDECGHVSCAMCGDHSFWTGAKCSKCKSRKVTRIGRIKDPLDTPTLMEDLEDRKF